MEDLGSTEVDTEASAEIAYVECCLFGTYALSHLVPSLPDHLILKIRDKFWLTSTPAWGLARASTLVAVFVCCWQMKLVPYAVLQLVYNATFRSVDERYRERGTTSGLVAIYLAVAPYAAVRFASVRLTILFGHVPPEGPDPLYAHVKAAAGLLERRIDLAEQRSLAFAERESMVCRHESKMNRLCVKYLASCDTKQQRDGLIELINRNTPEEQTAAKQEPAKQNPPNKRLERALKKLQ